jgi:phosphate transport system protein
VRTAFEAELEQVRLQVELMAVRVDQNLERMRDVVERGDASNVRAAFDADDEIDSMNVSLTERCYDLLRREAPVASDLRFIVSVLRVLSELERIGDLALRVIKIAPDHALIASNRPTYEILRTMADFVVERYRDALRAWATMDLTTATELATAARSMDVFYDRLLAELLQLTGPDAARVAITTFSTGRSLDRIGDHATIIGVRLRYLLTGDPDHLAAEVR